jgi:hypothetical protein
MKETEFKNGHKKVGGRTKGTPNKVTQEVRELFSQLVRDNLPQLKKDLAALEPYQRVNAMMKLSQFIIPKPTENHLSINSPEDFQRVVFEFGNPIDVWNTLPKEERLKIFDNDTSGSN